MSKKESVKLTPRTFSSWVDKRDLVKIYNSFTSDAVAQELLGSLGLPKKKALWNYICEALFSLSPAEHSHAIVPRPASVPEVRVNGFIRENGEVELEDPPRRHGKRRKINNTSSEEDSKENVVLHLPENPSDKASIVLSCMKHYLAHIRDKEPTNTRTVVDVLNFMLSTNLCGQKAIQICEIIWRKRWTGYEVLGAQCFQYMLATVVNNNSKKADVKRLVLYKEVVGPTAPFIPGIIPSMAMCLTSKIVLSDSSSVGLLSRFFTLSAKYTELFHSHVKKAMINQTKAEAKVYGQVYGLTLNKASPELQDILKNKCIQDFIQKYINVHWDLKAQKMKPHGLLLETFLEELYFSTASNPVGFKVLLDAFEPLLWRNLSSANPLQRATSITLLYMMYPIEPPNFNRVEQEMLNNKQNEFILMSLEDPNHVVRLISVKKVRYILADTWTVMPRPFRVAVCNAIFNKLAFDKSSSDIRREALITIRSFINDDNYHMCLFMSKFFKFLKPSIYDENKQVRKAMLQVLQALQEFRHPKALANEQSDDRARVSRCWDIVSLRELIEVMSTEEATSSNLRIEVELAFKSIHPEEAAKESSVINRVIWLIKQGQQLARNFYENSLPVLPTEKAIVFMTKVMGRLGAHFRDFDKKGKPKKKENTEKPVAKSRKRKGAMLESAEETSEDLENFGGNKEQEESKSQDKQLEPVAESLKNPAIVAGLLDVVMILWVKHAKTLNEKSHTEALLKFESTVQQSLEFIFREWKDNIQVLGPILHIGSMLPSKGMKRLLNFCINRIKLLITNNGGIPDQEIKMLATGVCNWDSADILLEMTGEWLAECIKTAISKSKSKAKKQVEVDPDIESKASAGLLILEKVITHPVAHAVIVEKSPTALLTLLKAAEGVKKVIDQRLTTQTPVPSMPDNLIVSSFKRYVALINLIPSTKETNFNPNSEFGSVLTWTEKIILPRTSEAELSSFLVGRRSAPLVTQLLSVVLRCIAIAAHKSPMSKELTTKVVNFCQKILSTPAATYLVSSLICTASGLFVNGVLIKKGKREGTVAKDLLEVTVPNLLAAILDAPAKASKLEMLIERDTVAKNELKSNIEELYNAHYAIFPRNAVQIHTLDKSFVKAVFNTLLGADSGDSGLPYFAEFLINEFQHSSLITPEKFWLMIRELVEGGLGITPQGRTAVEVFLVVVGTKWPSLLPYKYVDKCHQLLSSLASDKGEPEELLDLNQSFAIDQDNL
ncbi:condensin-2 complex subunit G2-like [Neocloeon triangulifer]|uniref:condensin-2 complex subunit G2-like n=1 Tax=Neocloeon triangulifer TaxID=2078957 RepID=UPI00286EF3EC|nr:condensin-2 complex subunit G2-like [Neocloeon triangulifer]